MHDVGVEASTAGESTAGADAAGLLGNANGEASAGVRGVGGVAEAPLSSDASTDERVLMVRAFFWLTSTLPGWKLKSKEDEELAPAKLKAEPEDEAADCPAAVPERKEKEGAEGVLEEADWTCTLDDVLKVKGESAVVEAVGNANDETAGVAADAADAVVVENGEAEVKATLGALDDGLKAKGESAVVEAVENANDENAEVAADAPDAVVVENGEAEVTLGALDDGLKVKGDSAVVEAVENANDENGEVATDAPDAVVPNEEEDMKATLGALDDVWKAKGEFAVLEAVGNANDGNAGVAADAPDAVVVENGEAPCET